MQLTLTYTCDPSLPLTERTPASYDPKLHDGIKVTLVAPPGIFNGVYRGTMTTLKTADTFAVDLARTVQGMQSVETETDGHVRLPQSAYRTFEPNQRVLQLSLDHIREGGLTPRRAHRLRELFESVAARHYIQPRGVTVSNADFEQFFNYLVAKGWQGSVYPLGTPVEIARQLAEMLDTNTDLKSLRNPDGLWYRGNILPVRRGEYTADQTREVTRMNQLLTKGVDIQNAKARKYAADKLREHAKALEDLLRP